MSRPDTQHASPPPGFEGRFVAELIAARASELADIAAGELTQQNPDLAARYHPLPRQKWTAHFEARLADLSAALFAEQPRIFASQLAWAKVAFVARGAPIGDLATSLELLRKVTTREVTPEDADTVDQYFVQAIQTLQSASTETPPRLSVDSPHGQVAGNYLLKILEGDRMAAAAVVHDAVRNGLPIKSAYLEVLIPVQRELGRMWHLNEITVSEEHFATNTTRMVMSQLLAIAEFKPRDGRAILTASVEGNTHDLGVRVLADLFEMAGWRTIYLGASVPIEDLVSAVLDFRTQVVALSVAMPTQIPTLERTIQALRNSLGNACPRIIIGGYAFDDHTRGLWRGLGADGFAESADAAIAIANRLVPAVTSP
jgi:methanogenic corrinoid protein MtbC1